MSKTVKLSYGDITVNRMIPDVALAEPAKTQNRIEALKRAFAEDVVTRRWLNSGVVTLEENCYVDETGKPISRISPKTISSDLDNKLEEVIAKVAGHIVAEIV